MSSTKVVILTSNAARHKYFCQVAAKHFDVRGIVSEPKHDYFEKQKEESDLVKQHFKNLADYESKYFADANVFPSTDTLLIDKQKINEDTIIKWTQDHNSDVILLFGTGILNEQWMAAFPNKIINIHLGLSPFYRGSATLFWPFYNDELAAVGVTFHIASLKVDAGDIIERVRPSIEAGDNYYDITNKAIRQGIDAMPRIITSYLDGELDLIKQQFDQTCKCYKKADFNEDVLQSVLSKYSKGISPDQIEDLEKAKQCLISL